MSDLGGAALRLWKVDRKGRVQALLLLQRCQPAIDRSAFSWFAVQRHLQLRAHAASGPGLAEEPLQLCTKHPRFSVVFEHHVHGQRGSVGPHGSCEYEAQRDEEPGQEWRSVARTAARS